MNPNLLVLVDCKTKHLPVMLDRVPAPEGPDAGPFLITSSTSLLWVERAFHGGFLRVAVRESVRDSLFRDIIEEISGRGVEREWGNVLPATEEGLLEGLAHLSYYDLSDPVLLYGADFDIGVAEHVARVPADWLPATWAVLIPNDRGFVGTAFTFPGGHVGAIVHNPSRGVVVLR
jgi:hypothetical protein